MRYRVVIALAIGATALVNAAVGASMPDDGRDWPVTRSIDVVVRPIWSNRLPACRITGDVVFWVGRRVAVLDDTDARLGTIQAGLAQFGPGARLHACVADDAIIDLSGQFANFLVAPSRGHGDVGNSLALASQLAQDFYHLAEDAGHVIPLVDGTTIGALGSVAYRYDVVLIADDAAHTVGAIVQRETVRTKFASRLPEPDRRATRLKWSSEPETCTMPDN
jgi:hypothetical protein